MRVGCTFPRWLSLCAAALVLLQLVGVIHLASAPHGVCWEHGVVVELDTASAGVRPTPDPEGLASAMVPAVRSDQHPHCPALWIFRQARIESSSSTPILAPIDRAARVASRLDVSPPAGLALHRAPKQSPPV